MLRNKQLKYTLVCRVTCALDTQQISRKLLVFVSPAICVALLFWGQYTRQTVLSSRKHAYVYNFDPLKPHFYILKVGFTGVYIIYLISAQKHKLWVLVRTASPSLTSTYNLCFEQKYEKYQRFLSEFFFSFWR